MAVNEISYNCVEQYIMAEEARFVGDSHTLTLIMYTAEPSVHKYFGRCVNISTSKSGTSSDRTSDSRVALPKYATTL
ncbi:unnamed protein product [Hapterophycus canaliculatus]